MPFWRVALPGIPQTIFLGHPVESQEVNSGLRSQMLGGTPAHVEEASLGGDRLARQLICPFIDRWKRKAERGSGELSAEPMLSCLSASSQERSSQHEAREQRRQDPSRGCQSGSRVARAEGVWEGPAPGIGSCRGQLKMTLKIPQSSGSSFAGASYGFSVRH